MTPKTSDAANHSRIEAQLCAIDQRLQFIEFNLTALSPSFSGSLLTSHTAVTRIVCTMPDPMDRAKAVWTRSSKNWTLLQNHMRRQLRAGQRA